MARAKRDASRDVRFPLDVRGISATLYSLQTRTK